MLLSIVVPVHNAAPWLPAMLDSLQAQRVFDREVILVDDGSTDASAEILEAWRRRDTRTRLIRQPHQGVSVARNRGLALARGDYVAFPDADDVLEPDMYRRLVEAARRGRLDIALCNARFLREGRPGPLLYRSLGPTGIVSGLQWMASAIRARELVHAVWPGVYDAGFLRAWGLRFEPELLLRQDVPWTTQALAFAQRVQFLDEPLYRYRVGERAYQPWRWKRIARSYMGVVEALERFHGLHFRQVGAALPELRWQLADQGLRIFNQTRRLPAAKRIVLFEEMAARGTDRSVLRNAQGRRQRWRAVTPWGQMRAALFFARAAARALTFDPAPFSARSPLRQRAP